jgi:hypothetical protein
MMKTTIPSLILVTLTAGLAACTSTTPNLDRNFGQAVNHAKAQQTLNPDASQNPDPVAGIDGPAAKSSVERYDDSFKAPPPTFNVININSGGGTGGGR